MATINGDGSDNSLVGTNDDDVVTGYAGNDRIDGQGGNDVIFGDDGDQSLPSGSLIYADTFDSGAAGWSPATTDNSEPFYGSILGQFGGTAASGDVEVSRNFVLDPNFSNAVIEFDFHRLDSWDNHDFEIFSDGQQIFSQTFGVGTAVGQTQTTTINGTTYTVSFTSLGDAAENGYWESGQFWTFDQSFAVRVFRRPIQDHIATSTACHRKRLRLLQVDQIETPYRVWRWGRRNDRAESDPIS